MKKIFYILLLLTGFASCSEKEETEVVLSPDGLFAATEVTFEGLAEGQTYTVSFEAPNAWTAEVHSIGSWLSIDRTYGEKGRATIVLKPRTDNFGVTAREAELDIYIDGYEPHTIKVYQHSASTGDIQVNGHVDNGVMRLSANASGTEFCDTIWVQSKKRWTLAGESDGILAFETSGESRNGVETNVRVIVRAAYSNFASTSYEGKFYIRTDEGSALPITVFATAKAGVYAGEFATPAEVECVSLNFQEGSVKGVYTADFYVESNVRWTLGSLPQWVENASVTNVLSSGQINPKRQHVSLRIKSDAVSIEGKSGQLTIVDQKGMTLRTLALTFAGVGTQYIEYSLSIPAVDPYGNAWGFEAKASYIDANNPNDYWKEMRHEFQVITATDYTSLADAPYHMILVRGDNGLVHKEEVHWAHLELSGSAGAAAGGLYTKSVVLCANDRGDDDDQNGLTNPTDWRYAFIYLVPQSVQFRDLWEGDGLKAEYADNYVLIAQKNDPNANYSFALREVEDGGTLNVAAAGGAYTFNIVEGSYTQCDITIESQNEDGSWSAVSSAVCNVDFTTDENGVPNTITFTLSENKGTTNPFTHVTTGAPRHLRVSVNAFTGNDTSSVLVYRFYIDQELSTH